jgi:hypothetical protein
VTWLRGAEATATSLQDAEFEIEQVRDMVLANEWSRLTDRVSRFDHESVAGKSSGEPLWLAP